MDLLQTLSVSPGDAPSNEALVAGRYRIERHIGSGGFGVVYLATDTLHGEQVALKVIEGEATDRFRRETVALRLLQLPGVVRLRDEFEESDRTCLVMDYVDGQPFPGTAGNAWEDLAAPTLSLLHTLDRVHGMGVVHRDLKPANVLVTAEGRAVILDFGLSKGPALGRTITQTGQILGTPAYFAPEQLLGQRTDSRADLYSLGVMLFEALAGELPHAHAGPEALLARGTRPALPLRHLAPCVPDFVAEAVDALLSVHPADRPGTASEVLQLLAGRGSTLSRIEASFPWLGSRGRVEEILHRARRGEGTRLGGGRGSGRTRTLLEVVAKLEAQGVKVLTLPSGSRPLSSLGGLLESANEGPASLGEALDSAEGALREVLVGGQVIVVRQDRPLDRWSREVLERVRDRGVVLETINGRGDLDCTPLSAEALEPLFGGHELVFHLRSDAARELHLRTDGVPGRVRLELAAWLRAGLAHEDDGRIVLDRDALVRLAAGASTLRLDLGVRGALSPDLADLVGWVYLAWPHASLPLLVAVTGWPAWEVEGALQELEERGLVRQRADQCFESLAGGPTTWSTSRLGAAHGSIADALPHGEAGRLFHLAAAGRSDHLTAAAADVAVGLVSQGRLAEAEAILTEALAGLRSSDGAHGGHRLAVERVVVALAWKDSDAVRRARLDLDRTGLPDLPVVPQLRELLDGWVLASDDRDRAVRILMSLEPFEDLRLERERRAAFVRASSRDPVRLGVALAELTEWAERVGDEETLASLTSWNAARCYREGRFDDAAGLHMQAANRSRRPVFVLSCQLNSASALQEAGRYREALELAKEATHGAASMRHPRLEARGLWIQHASAYRGGLPVGSAPELVDAIDALGDDLLLGMVSIIEAALAWRARDDPRLLEVAMRGASAFARGRLSGPELFLHAMAMLAGGPSERLAEIQASAVLDPLPSTGVQTAAILALAGADVPLEARERARKHLAALSIEAWSHNQGVLSWTEMAKALELPCP